MVLGESQTAPIPSTGPAFLFSGVHMGAGRIDDSERVTRQPGLGSKLHAADCKLTGYDPDSIKC